MEIKLVVIESAIKWLVGGNLLEFVKKAVASINDESIPNEEKRAWVIKEAKAFFATTGTLFISIALEVAVLLLRAELEDGNSK